MFKLPRSTQRSFPAITYQAPSTLFLLCHNGNMSVCEWRTRREHHNWPVLHQFQSFYKHHPALHSLLSYYPVWPISTSVACFVTLQFSDLVPYIVILKTFHVKMLPHIFHICRLAKFPMWANIILHCKIWKHILTHVLPISRKMKWALFVCPCKYFCRRCSWRILDGTDKSYGVTLLQRYI